MNNTNNNINEDEYPEDYFEPSHEKSVEDYESEKMEIVPIDLTLEEIGALALKAHKLNITLNDYLVSILVEYANEVIDEEEKVQEQLELKV